MRSMTRRSILILAVSAVALPGCKKAPVDLQNAPGTLYAGAGRTLVNLPIGIPTAGYEQSKYLGFMLPTDEPGSPYVDIFPATRGMESPPTAKAVVLDNGVSYMVIAKIDAVGITDVLTERVIQLAQQNIKGKYGDLEGKLILNADHTHDAGCRFSRESVYAELTQELGFGQFDPLGNALAHGFDTYSQQATDTVANSVVEAIQQAVSSLQPATFGYNSAYDTDALAGHDRRCAGDHIYGSGVHDDRVVVMRVDNASTGTPIAVMYNFAMHGTFYDVYSHFLSTDAPGHSEYMVEQQFNQPVVAMYLQGNAGNVSPSGGNNDGQNGEGSSEDMQHAGWELSQLVMQAWNGVTNTKSVLPLQVKERWTAISSDLLGYPTDAQCNAQVTCPSGYTCGTGGQCEVSCGGGKVMCNGKCVEDGTCDLPPGYFFPYGAVLCFQLATNNGTNPGCSPALEYTPAQVMSTADGVGICGLAPMLPGQIVNGVPTGSKYATRVAAARIGDLAIGVVPGEPVYGTGLLIRQGLLSGEFPGINDALVIGYAQDHDGYILQADDWLSGGYEPTITFWGWQYGAYQVQQSIDVFRQMFTGTALHENVPKTLPNLLPDPYTPIVPTNSAAAPGIDLDLPATSQRIDSLDVKFHGGDPGLGTPLITLQMQVNGSFVDVTKPTPGCGDLTVSCWTSGWIPVSNLSENDITVWYTATPTFLANPTATMRAHAWEFRYEPPIDLPVGTYRFHIVGQAKQSDQQAQYELDTQPVQISPNTNLTMDMLLQPSSGQLVFDGTLLYPQLLGLFEDTANPDWQTANFRALTPRWGTSNVQDTNGNNIPFSPAVPATTIPSATLTPPGGGEASVTLTYVTRTVPDTTYDYYQHPDQGSALHAVIPVSGSGTYTLSIPSISDAYGNMSQPTTITASM